MVIRRGYSKLSSRTVYMGNGCVPEDRTQLQLPIFPFFINPRQPVAKTSKDGISLSRLGMGVMRLPVHGSDADIDYKKAQAIIDAAMKAGINYYDTAYIYHGGKSEEFLGAALSKYPRVTAFICQINIICRQSRTIKNNLRAASEAAHRADRFLPAAWYSGFLRR